MRDARPRISAGDHRVHVQVERERVQVDVSTSELGQINHGECGVDEIAKHSVDPLDDSLLQLGPDLPPSLAEPHRRLPMSQHV